jgi:hypothetical protein
MRWIFLLLMVLSGPLLCAQTADSSTTRTRVFGLPIAFYTPDTRWGGGGSGILTFGRAPWRSSVTFSLAYTQNRQVLAWFPFQLYFPTHTSSAYPDWQLYGEVGWYRYVYQFFGVGNKVPDDFIERYTAQYPRVRATGLHYLGAGGHFAGARFAFDDYQIIRRDSGGLLEQRNITGSSGGRVLGGGPVWLKDTRNSRFYPTRGWWVEGVAYGEYTRLGSSFNYAQISLDAVRYLGWKQRNVLAINARAVFTTKGVPFYQMPSLGGTKRLRGYADGRYRDRHQALLQAEYRRSWGRRWGATAFAGVGTVWGQDGETAEWHPNAGLGVRFAVDATQRLNIRLDYGVGDHGASGFYLTIGEAF